MNYFKKITLGVLLSAQVLGITYGCSSDSLVASEEVITLTDVPGNVEDDWRQYVTKSDFVTRGNSIVFTTQEEYIKFVKELNESIDKSELHEKQIFENREGKNFSVRGGCRW